MTTITPPTLAHAKKTSAGLARGVLAFVVLAGSGLMSTPLAARAATQATVSVELKAAPHLMGCLANIYAEKKFGISAAKITLRNATAKAIRGYRVRFQLVDFSAAWSAWNRHAEVAAGRSIEDAYYPILDVAKVNKVVGVRWVYLKAQYQYKQADGQLVSDTETARLQILGRNLVEYSQHAIQPKAEFAKNWELTPLVMASLVSSQDPVIHQLAGRICGRLGGSPALYSPEATRAYMKGLYDFMADYLTYKSPDGDFVMQRIRQHVKFGRDVLADRAGTCIELAILYASACEAMGLEPLTVLIPGHVFAGVKIHRKDKAGKEVVDLQFVELTVIGQMTFEQACGEGAKKFNDSVKGKKDFVITDIKAMRTLGVSPLDLPAVEANWLAKVCPKNNAEMARKRPAANNSIVGKWKMSYRLNGTRVLQVLSLKADGTCVGVRQANGRQVRFTGKYSYDGRTFAATISTGETSEGTITWVNKDKFDYNGEARAVCVRVG